MGLRPWEVDILTPATFAGLWKLWRKMNIRDQPSGPSKTTADEEAEMLEAERRWGGK